MEKNKVLEQLKENKQQRLIDILNKVDEETRNKIIEQLSEINLKEIERLYENIKEVEDVDVGELKPVKSVNPDRISKEELDEYERLGANVIKNNKFAVVIMAGGEGTRLGFNGPKGTYRVDVEPKPKYLFEIMADSILRANKKYGVTIPWYIMTSNKNNDQIVNFMEEHDYFGYPKDYVGFFEQGELPLITEDGQLILDEDYKIRKAADGNGSVFKSMYERGVIEELKEKGIEWVYIGQIDNILLKMVDTLLLGVAIKEGSEIATRSMLKEFPRERMGTLCLKNGKVKVIEYSEIPEDMIEAKNEDGEMLFGESNVTCNLFSLKAIEEISQRDLPYHKAHKAYGYMDENCKMVEAKDPNAYKFEYFIFDAYEFFNQISVLRGKREEDFAPIKNKEGVQSPETAIKLYNDYWRKHKDERM